LIFIDLSIQAEVIFDIMNLLDPFYSISFSQRKDGSMRIAVLCIATNFKIRMKIGNKALLKQEDKIYMAKVLKELDLWVHHSKEEIIPVIITCFDEIYEMAVQMHFKAFNNEFGFLSEGHVIRFGINAYPDAEAYFIISTNDTRVFRAEIFETLCEYRRNNPDMIVISRINAKLTLPMVFSNRFIEPIQSIVDRENGKFVLRSNGKNAIYLDITDELIKKSDFHKNAKSAVISPSYGDSSKQDGHDGTPRVSAMRDNLDSYGFSGEKPVSPVVILRGGGKIATSIAITLHLFGFSVLIAETQIPATIYRGMSFAQAVLTSETEIEGIKACLVSPSRIQIQKAWNAKAIPVIIDPAVEVLKLFDQTTVIKSLFNEDFDNKTGMDILTYLENEKEQPVVGLTGGELGGKPGSNGIPAESDAFFSQFPLFALIDATSFHPPKPTDRTMAPITIGLREDQHAREEVLFRIEARPCPQYGKIFFRREMHVAHVKPEHVQGSCDGTASDGTGAAGGECGENTAGQGSGQKYIRILYSKSKGIYRENRKIGDEVEEGSLIGHVQNEDGSRTDVISPAKGRLIGSAASNSLCTGSSELAAVDSSIETKEECFQSIPVDKAVAYSVLTLLKGKCDHITGPTAPRDIEG